MAWVFPLAARWEGFTAEDAEDAEKKQNRRWNLFVIFFYLCVLCVLCGESLPSSRYAASGKTEEVVFHGVFGPGGSGFGRIHGCGRPGAGCGNAVAVGSLPTS